MTVQYLDHNGGRLAYDLTHPPPDSRRPGPDDGPLVVAVPGMGDVRQTYRFLVPALTDAGFRVATTDLRGHGDSSAAWSEYGTVPTAGDIEALVEHLGGPAVVIGHSFAAGSAARLAAKRPALVRAVVMTGPAVHHEPLNPVMNVLARLVTRNATLWVAYYKSLYPSAKPADFDTYLDNLKKSLKQPGRIGAVSGIMRSFSPDSDADLTTVNTPTLIVMGDKDGDHKDPAAEAQRIASELGGPATVHVVPGSGHFPHADAPDITAPAIVAFLQGL